MMLKFLVHLVTVTLFIWTGIAIDREQNAIAVVLVLIANIAFYGLLLWEYWDGLNEGMERGE